MRVLSHTRADLLGPAPFAQRAPPLGEPSHLQEACCACPGCWHRPLPQGLKRAPELPGRGDETDTRQRAGIIARWPMDSSASKGPVSPLSPYPHPTGT